MENKETNNNKLKYKKILSGIRNLPSLPSVIFEVSKQLENPLTGASELANIINRDQGLVAKILTVANSALYGLPRRVATTEFAIVILGFEHIKNIIVALSMIEAFESKNRKNWDKKKYWIHSLMTASIAKKIADDIGYPKSGEVFTAGLLHDLGLSIIQRYFEDEFHEIYNKVQADNCLYLEAEEEILGITHQEMGQFLLNKWNLPAQLSDCIANHHHPGQAENKKLTAIVHVADYMTNLFSTGDFEWDEQFTLDDSVIEILQLGDENYFEKFVETYKPLLNSQLESLNI